MGREGPTPGTEGRQYRISNKECRTSRDRPVGPSTFYIPCSIFDIGVLRFPALGLPVPYSKTSKQEAHAHSSVAFLFSGMLGRLSVVRRPPRPCPRPAPPRS